MSDNAALLITKSLQSNHLRISPYHPAWQHRAHVTGNEEIMEHRKHIELDINGRLMQGRVRFTDLRS